MKLEKRPKAVRKDKKFILVYFLGNVSADRQQYIAVMGKKRDGISFIWTKSTLPFIAADHLNFCI